MATTERDVFEALRSLDTSFLDENKVYNDFYAYTVKFHRERDASLENYNKAQKKVRDMMEKCMIVETSKFLKHVGGRDGDDYYNYDLYIGGVHVGRAENVSEYYSGFSEERRIEYAEEFIKEYEQNYEKNKKRLEELAAGPELAEYYNLTKKLDELNNKGFFGRLTEEIKIRQIKKRLEELKKYVDEYNNLKKYVDKYKYGHIVAENLPKLREAITERDAMHAIYRIFHNESEYNHSKEYSNYKRAKQKVKEMEKNAKDFKLAKYYREHEAEFANTRQTLLMIYEGIVGEEYLKDFKYMLAAYDQAAKIAKHEGKDFNTLKEVEQFEYFEAAQKVVEANKKYGTSKDGDGKQ